ncbi:GNAT family N-acetyltransferase [Mobilicoccus massiliensis]|uniref:GNAT family N-acetyltransferase n=1 Tax=Mobilicoccus massiliensis TaxID=1522310 RepID=UPI00058FF104|nr:GNAT family N-acetyltransferase [Mobilicoccus massiliensis]
MTVRIERAHVRDVNRVKPLWKLLLSRYRDYAGDDWPVRDAKDAWERRHQEYLGWINDGVGVIYLAIDDEAAQASADGNGLVGYAALRFVDSGAAMNLGEAVGVIETLVVHPDHREQGIGHQLLIQCRRELEKREIAFCCIETLSSNEEAMALIQKNGFRPYMTRLIRRIDND